MPDLMTPQQRLAALEELEARQQCEQRRAARAAWLSVVVAAVMLAAIVGFATWRLIGVRREIAELNDQKAGLKKEIVLAESKREAAVSALNIVPESQVKAAIEYQWVTAPKQAALLPRIYMQTIDASDRPRAEAVRKALVAAGYIVLGIENRPNTRNLDASDVRYYHDGERPEAERIAKVMEAAGERTVKVLLPEGFLNSPNVRPNHFEVWLVHRE